MTHANEAYVDLEETAKGGGKPPKQTRYRIRVDKDKYDVDVPSMTGREILALAGKSPEKYELYVKRTGGKLDRIEPDHVVDFSEPGIERFQTLPLDQTEGADLRREFDLPEEDREYLEGCGMSWEAVTAANVRRVIIYGFPVPQGYNIERANLHLRLEDNYPTTQIDMVYFDPPLSLTSGRAIGALSTLSFDGKVWQQWSRHRTAENPWQPGLDNIQTHLLLVTNWLQRELPGKAAA
jgi:hypothetical protein